MRVRQPAIPAPTIPNAGNPRWPKISDQQKITFSTFAARITKSAGRMYSRPWRYWRSAVKTRKKGMLGIWTIV
jgi:hypothetical protein